MVKPALPDYECSDISFKCWFKTNYLKKCYLPMRLLSGDFSHVIETRIGSPIQLYYIMQINSHLIWALQYSAPFLFNKISDALEMAQCSIKLKQTNMKKYCLATALMLKLMKANTHFGPVIHTQAATVILLDSPWISLRAPKSA